MVLSLCAIILLFSLLALLVVPARFLQEELAAYAEVLFKDDLCREVS